MKAGMNFADKNYVRKMINDPAGFKIEHIAISIGCPVDMVKRFVATDAKRAGVADPAPAADTAADEFGPRQGSPGWDVLNPNEKRIISTRRNAAAKESQNA